MLRSFFYAGVRTCLVLQMQHLVARILKILYLKVAFFRLFNFENFNFINVGLYWIFEILLGGDKNYQSSCKWWVVGCKSNLIKITSPTSMKGKSSLWSDLSSTFNTHWCSVHFLQIWSGISEFAQKKVNGIWCILSRRRRQRKTSLLLL